jgi:TrmH family RNA methyltransferase
LIDRRLTQHPLMLISSSKNEQVKAARLVREGKDRSLLFVEGERLVADGLTSGLEVTTVFHLQEPSPGTAALLEALRQRGSLLLATTPEVLAALSDTVTPQGIIVLARHPEVNRADFWDQLPICPLLVALDRVQDPGNLGTLLRTAEAAGAQGVITLAGTADPFSPKALRASMGSAFRLPLLTGLSPAELLAAAAKHGLRAFAAAGGASMGYRDLDWTGPTLLLLGNEGRGLDPALLAACDCPVRIPINPAVESLNVATAAAVLLFEAAHQRALKTPT